jgi:predicted ribonuclease YlaK
MRKYRKTLTEKNVAGRVKQKRTTRSTPLTVKSKKTINLTNTNESRGKKSLSLVDIKPKTMNQERIFREFDRGQNLLIHGYAGTGKSLIAFYLALQLVMSSNYYDKVVIIRTCVPSRSQGFLPGNENEKNGIFEIPYEYLATKIVDNSQQNPYKALKGLGLVEFMSTSYLRGQTIEHAVVIADEIQNGNDGEVNTIVTRIGEDSRIILIGDEEQDDLRFLREQSCMKPLIKRIKRMPSFSTIKMEVEDICRNGLLKEWILAGRALNQEAQNETLPSFINKE